MPTSSIGGLSPLGPSAPGSRPARSAAAKPAGADFGSALEQAIGALDQLGSRADASSLALAKGDPIDIHEVMLNAEQASLGFSLAVQVRNKLIDAYTEVMRMSV